jgi:hypothetical protein
MNGQTMARGSDTAPSALPLALPAIQESLPHIRTLYFNLLNEVYAIFYPKRDKKAKVYSK